MTRLALLTLSLVVWQGTSPDPASGGTARAILDQVRSLDDTTRHWIDRSQKLGLRILDGRGGERRRDMHIFDKRYPGDEDKSLSFFLTPAEVKGTGFLQWGHPRSDDDQWLYLPELKRTRRITAQGRDESFMGTAFSYRDLEILAEIQRWTEDDATSSLDGEEIIDGTACHKIAFRPKQDGMSYGRIVLFLDKDKLVARRLDFFDQQDEAMKRLSLSRIVDIGPIPTAHLLDMTDLRKNARTEVEVSDVRYNAGLADDLFTQRQLERGIP